MRQVTWMKVSGQLEKRVRALEKLHGWNRSDGWVQVEGLGFLAVYEFGRFAQMVDLLEEFGS